MTTIWGEHSNNLELESSQSCFSLPRTQTFFSLKLSCALTLHLSLLCAQQKATQNNSTHFLSPPENPRHLFLFLTWMANFFPCSFLNFLDTDLHDCEYILLLCLVCWCCCFSSSFSVILFFRLPHVITTMNFFSKHSPGM